MRRILATLGVVAFLLALGAAPASASAGAPPPGAVKDIPDIPSNTLRMTQAANGNWRAFNAADWWNWTGWKLSQPGTDLAVIPQTGKTVAVVPKPITAAAPLVRGAAGGPLIGSFMGGFALGTAGLEVYGMVTGNDPLDSLCGTPMEVPGMFLYMGSMPDCQGQIDAAIRNADAAGGVSGSACYQGFCFVMHGVLPVKAAGTTAYPNETGLMHCFSTTGTLPSGISYFRLSATGQKQVSSFTALLGSCSTHWPGSNSVNPWIDPQLRPTFAVEFRTTQGGTVLQRFEPSHFVQSSNPVRTASCSISWRDGTTTKGTGKTYTENDGIPISASGFGCKTAWDAKPGAGREVMPDRIGVESTDEAGAKTQIADQPVPEFSPTEKIALDPTLGNGRGLVLEKVVDGVTLSCMTWEADCAGWWQATSEGTSQGPYRCTYGGAPLSIGECGPYRQTFDTKTSTPTITDPSTGTQTPWQTLPSTGNSISPGTGPGTGADPAGECFAQGWAAFNPIEWVLTPIKCAMVWAFVPRAAVVTTTATTISTAWAGTMPGQLPGLVAGFMPPAGLSGCQGPHVFIPLSDVSNAWPDVDWYPLAACSGPAATVAGFARTIGAAILIFFTGLGIVRRASATVNAPGVGGGSA